MADEFQAITDYGKAIQQLSESTDSLALSFGEVSKQSDVWTMASRILSGSGLWKLQNYVRAVGNAIYIFSNNSKEAEMATLKQMEATMGLSDTYDKLGKSIKEASNQTGGLYKMMAMQKGVSASQAKQKAVGMLSGVQKRVGDRLSDLANPKEGLMTRLTGGRNQKAGRKMSEYLFDKRDAQGRQRAFTGVGNASKFTKRNIGGYAGDVMSGYGKGIKKLFNTQDKGRKIKEKVFKIFAGAGKGLRFFFGKVPKLLGRVLSLALGAFIQGMVYFVAIAIGIIFIVKIFKSLKIIDTVKNLLQKLGVFKNIMDGIMLVLGGFFTMFKGIFNGNFKQFFSGLFSVLHGVGLILWGLLKTILGIYVGIVGSLFNLLPQKIADAISAPVRRFYNKIRGRATGGIVSEPMTLVGERGPELVSLPNGARVHTNSQSRGMSGGGNNISVHVNGRVGASDTEIRDIANKVAREINIRMNRTGSAAGRF
tara:strand:+ start:4988 stop:6427 length:1440 start_codon:yes stop_codon:yes gene_type:complete